MSDKKVGNLEEAKAEFTEWLCNSTEPPPEWKGKFKVTAGCAPSETMAKIFAPDKVSLDKPLRLYPTICDGDKVKLLSKYVKLNCCEGALISVTHNDGPEYLYVLNTQTGVATGVKHCCQIQLVNAPEVEEDVCFLNYYYNGRKEDAVWEAFPTRKEADDNNLFYSRDLCAKVTLKRTDGVWAISSTIENQ